MKQIKAMNIYTLSSGFGKKAVVASVVLHVLIGLIFFSSPLIREGANPQVISVTFHQAPALSDQGGKNVPVAAVRKEQKRAAVHRPEPVNRNKATKRERQAIIEEEKPVVISRNAEPEKQNQEEATSVSVDAVKPESPSVIASSNENSSKAEETPENMTGQTGEARFGEGGAPSFIHREMPVYPALALRLGKEGRVLLKLLIDADGELKTVEVVEAAGYGFTEASLEAVRKSTYEPGFRNGVKVAMRVLLPVSFRLQ